MVFELEAEFFFLEDHWALVTFCSASLSYREGGNPEHMGVLLVDVHLDAVLCFASGAGFEDSGGGQ